MGTDRSFEVDRQRLRIAAFVFVASALMLDFGSLLGFRGVGRVRAIFGGLLVLVGGVYLLTALTPAFATRLGYPSDERITDLEFGTQLVVITVYFFLTLGAFFVLVRVGRSDHGPHPPVREAANIRGVWPVSTANPHRGCLTTSTRRSHGLDPFGGPLVDPFVG